MVAAFSNVYNDDVRADAYAKLEFPGTYYLAYRDLPAIIRQHVRGRRALDFGCGTGRSTRFLRELGFDVVGVDIAAHMLQRARERDPETEYRLVPDGDLASLAPGNYDLVLSAFTFDNIPTMERKVALFRALGQLLNDGGRIVNLVSAPEIYVHEWASFSTMDFPENRAARSGDKVRIVMLDVEDRRPVEDILWTDEAYQEVYGRSGLVPMQHFRPLAQPSEPFSWVSETTVAPWVIYVLGRAGKKSDAVGGSSTRFETAGGTPPDLPGAELNADRAEYHQLQRFAGMPMTARHGHMTAAPASARAVNRGRSWFRRGDLLHWHQRG